MKLIVGIIGGKGQMGQWFKRFFEKNNCKVLIADKKTRLRNKECASKSDIVVVSVPIKITGEIIKEIGGAIKKDALLIDITSLKAYPINLMLKYSKSDVIGTHPIFGPSVKSIKNQVIVLCPARIRNKKRLDWFKKILNENGAKIKVTSAKKHDQIMSVIQGITHFSILSVGHSLKELGVNVDESLEYSSPIYKIRMNMVGRILSQDPNLYADIEMLNPYTKKALKAYVNSTKKMYDIILKKDRKGFVNYFNDAASFLGNFKKKATKSSDYLIEQMVKDKK